ncbi:hypothetical protein D8B26_001333 [Coccidioides posadasii str. Silveira]|nr:hypothetical protein CPAG_00909 [Coccidioides posadasii RMSCC 3488]KMP01899.1 hypothetical protein CIRG_02038 [Coccidioides immitis RMSCC 2394]KMU79069.1 hypothetical protein CISG_07235 [Coccidioides immitis RMSCC 3703]KMU90311.1 hypothetical protein CIHG_08120 [Coccidioides immitis H538.4]QVM06628.1 hypothetical protein D8B26_001333 [Coccidioides posadasii str. Silveira]
MKFTLALISLLAAATMAVPVTRKRGDTQPVMTNGSKEIVPFDSEGVVTV